MRIATWNVNSLKVRLERVEEWIGYAQPDVLCLQETKLGDAAFPALAFEALGYESVHHGEGRWNGVAILSRVGITDDQRTFAVAHAGDPGEARFLAATCGGVRVHSLYVPNGRDLADDHYQYKLRWLADLQAHLEATCTPTDPVVVCGDFNIAPADLDVHPTITASTHTSPEVRGALAELEAWGLHDAFRLRYPDQPIYSWWDYRAGDFHKGKGLRIDLMLVSQPLAATLTFALIDRQARKGKSPSDHAPLFVDVGAP